MQVFKKFCLFAIIGLLMGCRSSVITSDGAVYDSISEINEAAFEAPQSFRVGVLLPLSGNDARYGIGLKQAMLMALDDMNNPNLILQFYDTQSSPQMALNAAQKALKQKAQMIIGPLTGNEVEIISNITKQNNIPVVAFSTNSNVLQNQVYSLGLLVEEQVSRIMNYAIKKGRSKFALLIPDNSTGLTVAKAAVKATTGGPAKIVKIAFYQPDTNDFSEIIKQLSDYDNRSAEINKQKVFLKQQIKQGNLDAKKSLQKLELKDTSKGVDFDAVLIPESGAQLKSAAAMFGYYDVFAPEVKFLGTSVWENTRLNKESTLVGSWYPAMSKTHIAYFNKKYHSLFGEYPQSLYAFAYDAVALCSAIARNNSSNINAAITNEDGFVGISGMFRILPDGKNEHSLDIIEVTSNGDIIIDPAPKKFSTFIPETSLDIAALYYNDFPPQILGKNQKQAEQQIFGKTLGNQYSPSINEFSFPF